MNINIISFALIQKTLTFLAVMAAKGGRGGGSLSAENMLVSLRKQIKDISDFFLSVKYCQLINVKQFYFSTTSPSIPIHCFASRNPLFIKLLIFITLKLSMHIPPALTIGNGYSTRPCCFHCIKLS